MAYIRRLLASNADMGVFAAPIVIPEAFRLAAIIALADRPDEQRRTTLQLF